MPYSDRRAPTDDELVQAGYRYSIALTHHPEDAEDLAQEAWLNLSRHYGRLESRAILFTTIRNLFIDQSRRRKVVHFESLDKPETPKLPTSEAKEPGVKGDLDRLLAFLRPNEREMLFLHYHQGHTAEEISRMMSQPRGTVLSLIHRAIGKLRGAAASESASSACN